MYNWIAYKTPKWETVKYCIKVPNKNKNKVIFLYLYVEKPSNLLKNMRIPLSEWMATWMNEEWINMH